MEHFVIDTSGAPVATKSRQDDARLMKTYQHTLKAKYDAAGLSLDMENWWACADHLSPRASANKATRKRIRSRARYECVESGSIAVGMIEALINAVVSYGPTLQIHTENKTLNRLLETEFTEYLKAIRFGEKLRTMFGAKVVDGEAFAERVFNPQLRTPVKTDVRLSEADLWTDPLEFMESANVDDGIRYNEFGNPISYKRMRSHPGDQDFVGDQNATDTISAENVIHWYKASRPGQRRGISEVASSLRPLAELRRYQLAVQACAETAANHAGVMFSTANAFSENPDEIEDKDVFMNVATPRSSLLTLPQGWDMRQLRAEQPTTSYVEFVEERVSAASRPIQMPLNIAMGSSRRHNFASAKLDRMQFSAANIPRRLDCAEVVADRVFEWWLFEANRLADYLPILPDTIRHSWQWPVDEPIDAVAQAKADEIYFNIGWLTDERFCKRNSIDVEDLREQWETQTRAREAIGDDFPQPGIAVSESLAPDVEPVEVGDAVGDEE